MQNQRKFLKDVSKALAMVAGIYVLVYAINSAMGGYWLRPGRDGRVRYKPEFGGLSVTVAILWQPRFGHNALGQTDYLGFIFQPLIAIDRAWIHRTHYLIDDDFNAWSKQLSPSRVHPKFRQESINARAKPSASSKGSPGKDSVKGFNLLVY